MAKQPGWITGLLIVMGACTPGGFLFLFALLSSSNIHFETPIWLVLAAAGGFGGWRLSKAV
jgi:hypothetical protein